jgi:AcrR family transcriptional regulator
LNAVKKPYKLKSIEKLFTYHLLQTRLFVTKIKFGQLIMGRRADHQRNELTILALDAGEQLVTELGMHGLTVRALMGRISYSAGTFYNLFDNLDDFMLRLSGRTLERMLAQMRDLKWTGDCAEDLKLLAARQFDFSRRNAHLWQIMVDHRLSADVPYPVWYRDLVAELLGQVEHALKPAFPDGRHEDRQSSALAIWAGLVGICGVTHAGAICAATEQKAMELSCKLVDSYVTGILAMRI